jgi:uncharacterized protein (TIGR01777 family)
MKILIAGASGMVGEALTKSLHQHDVIVLGRDKQKLKEKFPHCKTLSWEHLDEFKEPVDFVIHLCGENIGQKFWSKKFKKQIIESRTKTAQALIDWIKKTNITPHVLAANAIGFYGCYPDHHSPVFSEEMLLDENFPNSFLQHTSFVWQDVWNDLPINTPLTVMRFGVVLAKNQGMLEKLNLSYQFGMGAILGQGQQYISWISLDDLVKAIHFLIQHQAVTGPINLVSPCPVNQVIFGKTLAQVLQRPFFLKLPIALIKLLFGQMGEELLLSGQYVIPKRLNDLGFVFEYPQLEQALKAIYKKNKT